MRTLALITSIFFFAIFPLTMHAAAIDLTAPDVVRVGDTFTVEVFLDTEHTRVNAVEGSISFPDDLSLVDLRYGGSFISLWVLPPEERTKGTVDFAGVLPGGYESSGTASGKGTLFTLVFKAEGEGASRIICNAGSAYQDDGNGTELPLALSVADLTVLAADGEPQGIALKDSSPPEPFTPIRTAGEPYGIAGNVLVFATLDKDSGVNKYQVARSYVPWMPGWLLGWHDTESPHPVATSDEEQFHFIRALDGAGNARTEAVAPSRIGFMLILVDGLLLLAFVVVLFYILRRALRRF